MTPSTRVNPSWTVTANRTVAAITIGASRRTTFDCTTIGHSREPIPRIRVRLARFEPTTLPTATSGSSPMAASTETSISGALVPKPTTTTPTTNGATFRINATRAAPMTN